MPWLPLKELYRTLVRKLHPDFARDHPDRARRSELMARVNSAYAREDRILLELLYEQAEPVIGAAGGRAAESGAGRSVETGGGLREPTAEARARHAERRLATIAPLVASLERGLERLRATAVFRECEAARRKAESGGDFFAESVYEARRAARASLRSALDRADALDDALRAVLRRSGMPSGRQAPRAAPGPTRSAAWPAAWPAGERLLRPAVIRPHRRRPGEEARRLAASLASLTSAAARETWQVVLSLFALFGEASPDPPPGLATLADARERYESLRGAFPASPAFERAVTHLPPFLEIGLRAYPKRLVFGIQAKRPELLAGIRLALEAAEVLPVARSVLLAMGPEQRCDLCGKSVFLVHSFRARGIDELHALSCPACGHLVRAYRTFGAPAGLEALSPHARALGLVVDQSVQIGKSLVFLELLPTEQRHLTAKSLLARLAAVYPDVLSPDLVPLLRLTARGRLLSSSAVIRPDTPVRLAFARAAPLSIPQLEQELRARAQSRFQV